MSAWKLCNIGYPKMRPVKILISLRICACWSESSLGSHVGRCIIRRCDWINFAYTRIISWISPRDPVTGIADDTLVVFIKNLTCLNLFNLAPGLDHWIYLRERELVSWNFLPSLLKEITHTHNNMLTLYVNQFSKWMGHSLRKDFLPLGAKYFL